MDSSPREEGCLGGNSGRFFSFTVRELVPLFSGGALNEIDCNNFNRPSLALFLTRFVPGAMSYAGIGENGLVGSISVFHVYFFVSSDAVRRPAIRSPCGLQIGRSEYLEG